MVGVEPRNTGDWLLGIAKILLVPERRRVQSGGAQEMCIPGIRDLRSGKLEGVDPDAVDGAFAILTGGGAHEEPGCGDGNQMRFDVDRGAGSEVRVSCGHLFSLKCSGLKFNSGDGGV